MSLTRTRKLTLASVIATTALLLLLTSLTTTAAPGYTPPFHASSVWNRPISASPVVHPNSAQMINLLASTVGSSVNIDGIDGAWSVPVYYASPGTPLKQVCDAARYRPCEMVPVPDNVQPSPDSDAKTVIVDLSTSPPRAWSFWVFQRGDGSNGDWTAGWGAFGWGNVSANGDGIRNYGGGEWGGRVAGWNYYAGLIHPEEIAQGHINHALAFLIPRQVAAGTFVWPAAGSDGHGSGASAIPVGSRIQLDPSINVNTLPLSAGGKMIARALQVYGGWIADTGVAAAVDAREFVSVDSNGNPYVDASPWAGLLTHMDLSGFPVNKLRVLQANPAEFFVEGAAAVPTATNTRRPTNTPTPRPTNTPTPRPTNTPTAAGALPISPLTVWDDMNSGTGDWRTTGSWVLNAAGAYGGSGTGWTASGGGTNVLSYYRRVDLRNVPNAYLWIQSKLVTASTANPARVQVSLDGVAWKNVAFVSASSAWNVPSINLSAYLGKLIQLRFVWFDAKAGDSWRLDDMTIGMLASNLEAAALSGDTSAFDDAGAAEAMPTDLIAPEQPRLPVGGFPSDSLQTPIPTEIVISPVSTVVPTDTSVNPLPTAAPTETIGLSLIESDSAAVSTVSTWTLMAEPAGASGGSYLINSDPSGTMSLSFHGSSVGIAFVQGPSFGQFAIEIDGLVQQVVNGNAPEYLFGRQLIAGLNDGDHVLRVIPQAGVVAIDAFIVNSARVPSAGEPLETTVPETLEVPPSLPTADTRFPTLDAPLAPNLPTRSAPVLPGDSTLPAPIDGALTATVESLPPAATSVPALTEMPTLVPAVFPTESSAALPLPAATLMGAEGPPLPR